MLSHCLKCREKQIVKTLKLPAKRNKAKLIILSKCAVCDTKNLRFNKEQKASGLLKRLRIKARFSKIPLVGPFLL